MPGHYNTIAIREMIIDSFSLEELERFCYDYCQYHSIRSTDYLSGSTLPEKAFALVGRAEREGWLDDLVSSLQKERPLRFREFEAAILTELEAGTAGEIGLVETLFIPAGHFWMGSAEDDAQARPEEKPQRRVVLSPYRIAKYPVTNVQYDAFVQAAQHAAPDHWLNGVVPSYKENHPVVNVSYEDVTAFCRWLSMVERRFYRLPFEEEWERAARGTDKRRYPWGNEWHPEYCNTKETGLENTTAVEAYQDKGVSPCCVVDMAGNVAEWTSSWYERYQDSLCNSVYFGRTQRVVRGGSWIHEASWARVSFRGHYKPDTRRPYLGFRVVLEVF